MSTEVKRDRTLAYLYGMQESFRFVKYTDGTTPGAVTDYIIAPYSPTRTLIVITGNDPNVGMLYIMVNGIKMLLPNNPTPAMGSTLDIQRYGVLPQQEFWYSNTGFFNLQCWGIERK